MLRRTSINRKLALVLTATGLVTALVFAVYLQRSGTRHARAAAKTKATEMLARSGQMFLVSTAKYHDDLAKAKDQDAQDKITLDWRRTIVAVDEAVIHDFGQDQPRVRLIGDVNLTSIAPLGGEGIKIQIPFEERALREQMAGKEMVEEWDDQFLRISVPLKAGMHAGCAECHGQKVAENKILGSLNAYVPMAGVYAEARGQTTVTTGILIGIVALLTIVIGLFLVRDVIRPIRQSVEVLTDTTDQINASSHQLSGNSQSLAEGASQQAASLEETSASLEEMASMTKRNAENAQKASDLAKNARTAADTGATDILAMSQAMQELKTASDDIGKIIKTIDEIAFQTNILALNAAVEAARAGEAGMGFAVVADEVRNLAQRSAQAAKETAAKIEGAVTKTGQGVQISEKVAHSLQEIVNNVRKVDELVAEVATASKEQSQGISQVTSAVTDMDKITQANAASAEESASAAEEFGAQAQALKGTLADLRHIFSSSQTPATSGDSRPGAKPPPRRDNGSPKPRLAAKKPAAAPRAAANSAPRPSPLPMEGDFKDF